MTASFLYLSIYTKTICNFCIFIFYDRVINGPPMLSNSLKIEEVYLICLIKNTMTLIFSFMCITRTQSVTVLTRFLVFLHHDPFLLHGTYLLHAITMFMV